MTTQILYLFPDNNLFIQCRSLQEIDWSEWANFEEIHLIVCRPVQREIDNQKNRGNDRVGRRARKTSTLFREIALGTNDYELIREGTPQVKLFLESLSRPSPKLADRLDYGKSDDEIVGCLYRFRQEHPDKDARLLSHDTGPILTAKDLNLPFIPVKEAWILPPENTESGREITRLKNEIDRLERTEPQFQIRCVDEHDAEVEELKLEYHAYEALTDTERLEFMDFIRSKFPLITDFGPSEPAPIEEGPKTIFDSLILPQKIYTPASDEAITKYRDQDYPAWIERCEQILSNLHITLQRNIIQPSFCFAIKNKGSRPGKNVLVIFTAKGNFKICPPRDDDDENSEKIEEAPCLPVPPRPPRGRWESVSWAPTLGQIGQDTLRNLIHDPAARPWDFPREALDIPTLDTLRRDPDVFYYKSDRPETPVESFSLECEQWRHGIDEEYFDGQIFFDHSADEVRGAIECNIHAENLSTPGKKTVPVKITVKRVSTLEHARILIKNLQTPKK